MLAFKLRSQKMMKPSKKSAIAAASTLNAVVVVAATLAVVAGCSDATTSQPVPPTTPSALAPDSSNDVSPEHGQADITFAQSMIPHHQQAIDMSDMAAGQAASQQVKDLAAKIKQAQDPEIEQLTSMLEAWGAPEPESGGSMPGMDHGGSGSMGHSGMRGMMSDQQMKQMEQAKGAAFDKMFLQMMVEHHNGAIQMAQTELAQGQNAQAKTLAQKIIDDQRSEITIMEGLLKSM